MTRPRLLVVTHDYTLTGAPIALFNAVARLTTAFDIHVVSQTDGALRRAFLDAGIDAQVVPSVISDANVSAGIVGSYDMVLCNTLVSCVPIYSAHRLKKPSLW